MPLHHLTENEVITEQPEWKDTVFLSGCSWDWTTAAGGPGHSGHIGFLSLSF